MAEKKKMKGWEDWMDKELTDRELNQEYGTVVKSPNGKVHVLKSEKIGVGGTGTTLCGQEFIADSGTWPNKTNWELYEEFFFKGPGIGDYITCKKCRALETKRMEMEILEETSW